MTAFTGALGSKYSAGGLLVPGLAPSTVLATALTAAGSTTPATSYLTASISPAANSLLAVWVDHAGTATLPAVSGLSLTWTRLGNVSYSAATRVLTVHTAPAGASPGSGQLTITGGSMTLALWSVVALISENGTTPTVVGSPVSATGTGVSTLTGTLPAPASGDSRPIAGFGQTAGTANTVDPEAGWAELSDTTV